METVCEQINKKFKRSVELYKQARELFPYGTQLFSRRPELYALWQAPISIILSEVGLPLARNAMSTLAALGSALRSAVDELYARPTGLLLVGYAELALGVTLLWTRVVFRRWQHVIR